jgi:hypothetical protein
VALSSECEVHDWFWDSLDEIGCPVCYGIDLGQKRVVGLMEEEMAKPFPGQETVKAFKEVIARVQED